ncbi:MAG: glycosyltransferase [Ferruginibacter sp.]
MIEQKFPVASICCMTKDLQNYIADGINSFLAQKTTYSFEIILSDDFSSDNTVEVCRGFQRQHPNAITILTSEKKLGLEKNFIKSMKACRGKYIAFCDGDDYWTDPLKLQKQIDYLEENPDCNLVCSDYDYVSEDGVFIKSEWKKEWYEKRFDIVENLKCAIATTLTTVIRKSALEPLLNTITVDNHPFIWDTVLWAFCLKEGFGYCYPEKMALRRVLYTGEYTTKSVIDRAYYDINSIYSIQGLIKDKKVQAFLGQSLYAINITIAKENLKTGNANKARSHLINLAFKWKGIGAVKNNFKYIYWFFKTIVLKPNN